MICQYEPYKQKNDQELFKNGLEKATNSIFNYGFEPKSKMFRFACWVRNLDGEYKTNWLKTAGKVGLAAIAVFGMIITSPIGVGVYLLAQFVTANKNITRILNAEKSAEDKVKSNLDERQMIIDKLGGSSILDKIPVVNSDEVSFIEKTKLKTGELFNFYIFGDKDKDEVEKVFANNKTPVFQSDGNLLSVWIQNKNSEKREVLIMLNSNQRWTFANLSNTIMGTNTPDFGSRFAKSEESAEMLSKVMNGTHDKYKLVQL